MMFLLCLFIALYGYYLLILTGDPIYMGKQDYPIVVGILSLVLIAFGGFIAGALL